MIVTGRQAQRAAPLVEALEREGITCSLFSIPSEPTVNLVREGTRQARDSDFVIGFGGGSAMDGAKAIAAVAANSGEPLDYLEVIGSNQKLGSAPKPFVAIPTTAGTGAEVTRNAVLESEEHGVKASIRDYSMLARIALVDPDLTLHVPADVTASTGLDTLTQLVEAYTSTRANALVDLFCLEGLKRVAGSLRKTYHNGKDVEARESMSFASLLSGLALANAGLGVVHGFAAPLGGTLHAPHGAICAALIRAGMSANIRKLRSQPDGSRFLDRYRTVAEVLTRLNSAQPEDGVEWVRALCAELHVKSLQDLGLRREALDEVTHKAAESSSMKTNPVKMSREELMETLEQAS